MCGPGTQIPRYGAAAGQVKVSAAWLIEHAGFGKGYPGGRDGGPLGQQDRGPRISAKHTLALVNPGGSSTKELLDLATEIANGVRETFGADKLLVAGGEASSWSGSRYWWRPAEGVPAVLRVASGAEGHWLGEPDEGGRLKGFG